MWRWLSLLVLLAGCGARTELGGEVALARADGGLGPLQPACLPGDPPVALAAGQTSPFAITLDDANVYFTNLSKPGSVVTVPKTGGKATTLAANQDYPDAIAVDAAHVFWTDGSGAIRRASKDGTGLVDVAAGQSGPTGIALDADHVYWLDYFDPGAVRSMAKTGGTPTTLTTGGTGFSRAALGESDIAWVDSYTSRVLRIAKTGGVITEVLHLDKESVNDVAVDGPTVYVASTKSVFRVDSPGASPTWLASTDSGASLALSPLAVYFTDPAGGLVQRVPKVGGATTTLAAQQGTPDGIAVDDSCVYWTNGAGSVMKAPR